MNDLGGIDGLGDAAIVLMLRANLISESDVLGLADEYDRRASWDRSESESNRLRAMAHRLRVVLMEVDPAPMTDPAVEYRAQFERDQIRRRTEYYARKNDEA